MDVQIRPVTPADLVDLLALLHEFAVFEKLEDFFEVTRERLDQALFGENGFVEGLIAVDSGKAVGYALFFPEFTTFRGQRGYYLEDLFVTEAYRGRQVGELLLRSVAKRAAERGFERIDLVVLDWNKVAIDFYTRHGAVSDPDGRQYKFTDDAFRRLL